ncbi:MAG: adenosylcobinamide-GDP ribazoletransferase [Actinobacteria bacterium]|nr:MAG: adenosylcobinamide-GDP ribazoletransferase [Actinomycetota bacterium]
MKGFRAAVGLLTRVPSRPGPETEKAIPWLPVVGALVGAGVALIYIALRDATTPLAAAAVAIGAGALVTGGFHEDGLADTADAFGADVSRERRLAILKDPHHGTFGVLALVVSVAARIAGVSALDRWGALAALPAAHALSRAASALQLWLLPAATPTGLGATYSKPVGRRSGLAAGGFGVVAGVALLGGWSIPAAAIAILVASAMGWLSLRKIGGITGDVLGATQQLVELGVLLLCVSAGSHVPWWRG